MNTNLVSLFVYLTIIGALAHLNAPEVIDGAVPTRQLVRVGMIFGLGIFLVAILFVGPIWCRSRCRDRLGDRCRSDPM